MDAVPESLISELRPKILDRRTRLRAAAGSVSPDYIRDLLSEIDAALERIDNGSYGLCESCHDPIEAGLLERNPLARFCLDHLSEQDRKAHEQDLELAAQIQAKLLPSNATRLNGWDTHYRYEPAGTVGGDYCELIVSDDGKSLFFAVGDVAGKGVAASLLMTHLSAILRSLLSLNLPLAEVMSRANRLFCDSTAAGHYATLVCGRTSTEGVELCNAGHCSPLLLRQGAIERLDSTGLPLGLFCDGRYTLTHSRLAEGDSLVLYSDGITEAQDRNGDAYTEERLIHSLRAHLGLGAQAMADGVIRDVAQFRGTLRPNDDMTLLIVRRLC